MSLKPYKGDIGTEFILTITYIDVDGVEKPLPLTDLQDKYYIFQPPGGPDHAFTRVPDLYTPSAPTDGKLIYIGASGDLLANGQWQLEGWVQTLDGEWYTEIVSFEVLQPLATMPPV
jgi:hypothetical protein